MPDSCNLGGQCWSFLPNFGITLLLGHVWLFSILFRNLYLWFFTVQSPAIFSVAVVPAATSDTKLECSGDSRKHAGQSEKTVLFQEGGLKKTGSPAERFIQRVNTGAAAMGSMRKINCFLNIKACKHVVVKVCIVYQVWTWKSYIIRL